MQALTHFHQAEKGLCRITTTIQIPFYNFLSSLFDYQENNTILNIKLGLGLVRFQKINIIAKLYLLCFLIYCNLLLLKLLRCFEIVAF